MYNPIVIFTLIINISIVENNIQIINETQHIENTSSTSHVIKVIINEIILNESQIVKILKIYGIEPTYGSYWYNTKNGLYGRVRHPTTGFMFPHH